MTRGTMISDDLRGRVIAAIDARRDELIAVSHDVHSHPEVNYQEHHSAAALANSLEANGFDVERGVGGVETAFSATVDGNGDGPTIALLAEYDALPGIGHGCGHNLIAISNLGAGFGASAAMGELPGKVVVLGTPAEEGGGGKIRMMEAGVLDGVDVTLSSHPSSHLTVFNNDVPVEESFSLAMVGFRFIFRGQTAHAAARPEAGVNALNGVIHLFTGIDAMRQHLRSDTRIHGVITDGGGAPNVVPDFAAANFMLRARDRDYLRDEIVPKVRTIAEGAATITGAELTIEDFYPFYENVIPNNTLSAAVMGHAEAAGIRIDAPTGGGGGGASTDFGNVSQAMPSYAMSFAVSETPVPGHSPAMTAAAITDLAHENALITAKALALTTCDLLSDPGLVARAREEFDARIAATNRTGS
ncbi:MAG: M20 family metallopeptidase [Dehalococcoidia bacterium]|jgi:amidohydrolase|nr:M20 family metallopeptidase [Dehalococcoidia bacterium]